MKSDSTTSLESYYIARNSNLTEYLNNLSRGRKATPHSWLYERETSEKTLERWKSQMSAANNKSPLGEVFDQFDLKQIEKFGPQGAVPPVTSSESLEVVKPLYVYSPYNSELKLRHLFSEAHTFAREVFGRRYLNSRPLSFESVVDNMNERDTLSTNSGFPLFTRRKTVVRESIQDAKSGKAYEYPAIILFRQYNGKLRPVWMFPMSLNLIEFSYSQVVQKALQQSEDWVVQYLTPWKGYDDVKQTLTNQWHLGKQIDGGDTTKMDANMRPAQLRLCFEIMKWLFQQQYWPGLYKSLMHVNNIRLLYSTSKCWVGTHGLASGSGWTQLVETTLQLFMAWRIKVRGQGIGDDFYWLSDMSDVELVDYLSQYGLPANPAKQTVSTTELTFLQRLNHQDFFSRDNPARLGGYYPTIRALNSLLNPEKFHKPKTWNSDMFCTRVYMILENCVDDPCFDEFVNFVVKGQRDLIPFANKKDAELNKIQQQSLSLPGLVPTYNQEKRTKPLSSFTSIQLVRKMYR